MATRKKPVLDIDALEVEATGEPFLFKFGGKQYIVPAIIDFRVAPFLREGDYGGAVELLVGPVQWQSMRTAGTPLTMDRALAIWTGFAEHMGTTAGKSSRSSRS